MIASDGSRPSAGPAPRPGARLRRAGERLVVTASGLLVFLLVLEVGLRILGATYDAWLHRAGERPGRPGGTVILAVGDSMTYGVGATPGQDYPAQLERLLNGGRDEGGFQVVNGGVGGANSAILRARLPRVLDEVRPDLVLLLAGTANHTNFLGYGSAGGWPGTVERVAQALQVLRIARLARIAAHSLRRRSVEVEPVYDGVAASVSTYLAGKSARSGGPPAWLGEPGFVQGVRMLQFGRYAEAEAHFAERLRAGRETAGDRWALGVAQAALRKHPEAIASFEACLALDPRDPDCCYGIGEVLLYPGTERAADPYPWFRRAADLDPTYAPAWWGMAMAARDGSPAAGDQDPVELLKACIEADPEDARCYPALIPEVWRDRSLRPEVEALLERHADRSRVARDTLGALREDFDQQKVAAWVEADLDAMVALVQARGLPVVVHGYPYPDAINAALQRVAQRREVAWVDHLPAFTMPPDQRRAHFAADGFHCNDRGYALMAGSLQRALLADPTLLGGASP